ncbi:MAG: diaminopimelate epimerase [Halieaceae bacterium]|jgi:diaminopimelate epimerase
MVLHFSKMHGLGNDFVVIDLISQNFNILPRHVLQLADRHAGVGCDQVLLVEPPRTPEADFTYRIFNADGGEVEQCGNGARCFAKFVCDQKLTRKKKINVDTKGGMIELNLLDPGNRHIGDDAIVEVNMGAPEFEPSKIPFQADTEALSYLLDLGTESIEIGAVSVGNPHAVIRLDNVADARVADLGPLIECHPRFPDRTNVGFISIKNRTHIDLRVFERGVGETRACGTGACAAVVYARARNWLDDSPISVRLTGGELQIRWHGPGEPVIMVGSASTTFEGQIRL